MDKRFLFRCFRRRDQEERCLTGDCCGLVRQLEEVIFAPGVALFLKEGVFAWMKGIGSKVSGFVLRDSWSLEPGDSRCRRRILVSGTCQGGPGLF